MRNQVFISYRHEGPEHAARVRRLGMLLREAKIPVLLDQFYLEENPGGPDEGWPKWCSDAATGSQCVLVIASEGWFAEFDGTGKPDSGKGVAAEAAAFRQYLHDEKAMNARIRLTFLPGVNAERVPEELKAWHQFRPFDTVTQLDQLIRWVAGCLCLEGVEPPMVRWPEPIDFQPDLADRTKREWPAIVELLAGRSRERILLLEGASGVGKSELMEQARVYAKRLGIPVAIVDFKGGGLGVEDVLGTISLELDEHLPNFSREGSSKTHLLRKDLRALRRPVLLIFDVYEAAKDNKTVADWLSQQLLAEVETALGMAVIVAGQKVPEHAKARWRDLAAHLPLGPILELEAWNDWVSRRYPHFQGDLRTLVRASGGSPIVMATLCATVAKA